nr:oxidoreductase afly [Quercus suber]
MSCWPGATRWRFLDYQRHRQMYRACRRPFQTLVTRESQRQLSQRQSSMATASKVQLTLGEWPEYHRTGISAETSRKASTLLQENHDQHHIFFNQSGFHDHIAHHLLTLWALRASPQDIQRGYDTNKTYQRPMQPLDSARVVDMRDPKKFKEYLGNEKYYQDFLAFFKAEMESSSWQEVLQNYVFSGDERADDMLVRMFAGFLHPIIHLGFGIEFHQPAIIAEALAQAAVHDNWMGRFLLPAEKAARTSVDRANLSIVQLLDEIRGDEDLKRAPLWSDGNKLRDGVFARAGDRMVHIGAQVHVPSDELELKTAEMTNATAYYTGGAQRPDRVVKYDFYYMHCINCSIFFSAFLKQDWLSTTNKVRLLEWKIRNDLAMYASRRSPEIRLDIVRGYHPKQSSDWDSIEDRVVHLDDDGHASKLVRALAHGQRICEPYESREEFRVKRDDWLQLGHMAIDSVEDSMAKDQPNWVRSAGFDEAWEEVETRSRL